MSMSKGCLFMVLNMVALCQYNDSMVLNIGPFIIMSVGTD